MINKFVGFCNNINIVGKTYSLNKDQMFQVKEKIMGSDKIKILYGENPTPRQLLQMMKDKGLTYQIRGIESIQNYHDILFQALSSKN